MTMCPSTNIAYQYVMLCQAVLSPQVITLHTFFGGTAILGQVQEEIIEVGINARNELFLMEEVEAALEVKSNEAKEAAVELARLKVANDQVQIAAAIPAAVEAELATIRIFTENSRPKYVAGLIFV